MSHIATQIVIAFAQHVRRAALRNTFVVKESNTAAMHVDVTVE